MNKYHQLLGRIITSGNEQENKKGSIRYLLNERLELTPGDLLDIFEDHGIARKKLRTPAVYEWGTGRGKVPQRRDHLVGLLRFHAGKQLSHLFGKVTSLDRADQPGETQQQELRPVSRLHRCRE